MVFTKNNYWRGFGNFDRNGSVKCIKKNRSTFTDGEKNCILPTRVPVKMPSRHVVPSENRTIVIKIRRFDWLIERIDRTLPNTATVFAYGALIRDRGTGLRFVMVSTSRYHIRVKVLRYTKSIVRHRNS